jgi:hypothetical protein
MRAFKIKLTILRSNPQIIREFWIDADRTFQELQKLIHITLGWKSMSTGIFRLGDQQMNPATPLAVCLHQELPQPFHYTIGGVWNMLLKVTEAQDHYAQKEPLVTRYRGFNPPSAVVSMEDLNVLLQFNNFRYAFYQQPRFDAEKYQFSIKKVNYQLQTIFNPTAKLEPVGFDEDIAEEFSNPLLYMLNIYTLNELREMLSQTRSAVHFSSNKKQLIKNIIKHYNCTSFWSSILDEMSLKEYHQLKDICVGKNSPTADQSYPVLEKYLLVCESTINTLLFAKEFLDFYKIWLNTGNEHAYISRKRIENAIIAGCSLYGVLIEDDAIALLDAGYPNSWDHTLFKQMWNHFTTNAKTAAARFITKHDDFYYCIKGALTLSDARSLRQLRKSSSFPPYIPTDTDFLEMAGSQELDFEESLHQELFQFLTQTLNFSNSMTNFYLYEIYWRLHIGSKPAAVTDYVCHNIHLSVNSKKARKLADLLTRAAHSVRSILYLGYTQEEYVLRIAENA